MKSSRSESVSTPNPEWPLRTESDLLEGMKFAPDSSPPTPEEASLAGDMSMIYYGPNRDSTDRGQYWYGRVKSDDSELGPIVDFGEGEDVAPAGMRQLVNERWEGNNGDAKLITDSQGRYTLLSVAAPTYGKRSNSNMTFVLPGRHTAADMTQAAAVNFPRQIAGLEAKPAYWPGDIPVANVKVINEEEVNLDEYEPKYGTPSSEFEAGRQAAAERRGYQGYWFNALDSMPVEQFVRIPNDLLDSTSMARQKYDHRWHALEQEGVPLAQYAGLEHYTSREALEVSYQTLIPTEELRPKESQLRSGFQRLFNNFKEQVRLNRVEGRGMTARTMGALRHAAEPAFERFFNGHGLARDTFYDVLRQAHHYSLADSAAQSETLKHLGLDNNLITQVRREEDRQPQTKPQASEAGESGDARGKRRRILRFPIGRRATQEEVVAPEITDTSEDTVVIPAADIDAAAETSPKSLSDKVGVVAKRLRIGAADIIAAGSKRAMRLIEKHPRATAAVGIIALAAGATVTAVLKYRGIELMSGQPHAADVYQPGGGGGPITELPDTPDAPDSGGSWHPRQHHVPDPNGPEGRWHPREHQAPTPDTPQEPGPGPEVPPATGTEQITGPNDTISDHARQHLIDQGIADPSWDQTKVETQRILDLNGMSWEDAHLMLPGADFKV